MRGAFTIIALVFVVIAPYWLYMPIILIGIIIFPLYLESILLSLAVDIFYGGAGHGSLLFGLPFTLISAVFVLFAIPFREYIRFQQ